MASAAAEDPAITAPAGSEAVSPEASGGAARLIDGPAAADAAAGTSGRQQVPEGYTVLSEGKASILQKGNDVFYNPVQVVNRDLSIAVLRHFAKVRDQEAKDGVKLKGYKRVKGGVVPAPLSQPGAEQVEGLHVLEGLAASGLRAIRYGLEVEGIGRVDANDLDRAVVEAMERNIAFNGAQAQQRIRVLQGDARIRMLQSPMMYDAVDLDPYGTPAQLLDSAVQAVADGGLLLVTATDMAVLCGNNGESCWAKYGSYPLHRAYCHEQALRIVLGCIEAHANRYKRHIVPVLSLSVDFYVRIFVRIHTSPTTVKDSPSKLAYVHQSLGCDSFYLQRVGRKTKKANSFKYQPGVGPPMPERCPETGSPFVMGGPLWAEAMHDLDWVQHILQHVKDNKGQYPSSGKLVAHLTAVSEELPDVPLYVSLHDMCKTLRCTPPRAEMFRSALINAGYRASGTHANPLGCKTDAPFHVMWDVLRCWVKDHPVKSADPNSNAAKILAQEPKLQANFGRAKGAMSNAKQNREARFPNNPEPHWGPKPKHGRIIKVVNGVPQAVADVSEAAAVEAAAAEGAEASAAAADGAEAMQEQ